MRERRYWVRFRGDPAEDPREPTPRASPARAADAAVPVPAPESAPGPRLRPASAPAGGAVAVCPHCWQLNVGAERLCGRCGADMTLLLQESGGLRRTPAVQSPVPVRVSGRLGPVTRALLLVLMVVLALAWLIAPLLGAAYRRTNGRQMHSPQRAQRAQRFTEAGDRGVREYAVIPVTNRPVLNL